MAFAAALRARSIHTPPPSVAIQRRGGAPGTALCKLVLFARIPGFVLQQKITDKSQSQKTRAIKISAEDLIHRGTRLTGVLRTS